MPQTACRAYFVDKTRDNLHIVLAFSPIGDAFRERLRQFPSLVNCCTIDWFTAWPDDALEAVAMKFLRDVDLTPDQRNQVRGLTWLPHLSTFSRTSPAVWYGVWWTRRRAAAGRPDVGVRVPRCVTGRCPHRSCCSARCSTKMCAT